MDSFRRCSSCGNPLEPGVGNCPWCHSTPAAPRADAQERFGKYLRTEKLGAGGMGEVWKAHDTELDRWVALKFLRDEDPAEVARFQREARTAAALSHPNIAQIYEIVESGGRRFIAMQYVPGRTLETYPRDDRTLLVRLIRDAARAVDHAHHKGIIHRDLKPENLMVEDMKDGPRIAVLDFGLARPIEGGEKLSVSGTIVGTAAYMSPEQARGDRLDERTDVYSIGATLYEILTGRPPFAGPNLLEILRKAERDEPSRPRRIDPQIHKELETIVLKCMEKDRTRRYASAGELADDLDRFLNHDPIRARPASTIYRIRKGLAKRKALATVAVAGIVAVGALGWQLRRVAESDRLGREEAGRRETVLKEIGILWSRMVEAKQGLHIQPVDLAREAPQVLQRIRSAIEDVSEFIRQNPGLPQGYYIRARGHLYLENFRDGESDLRRSVSIEPRFNPGHALLGKLLMQRRTLEQMEQYRELMGWMTRGQVDAQADHDRLLKEAEKELVLGARPMKMKETWGLTRTREDDVSDVLHGAMVEYYVEKNTLKAVTTLEAENARDPSEEYMNWLGKWAEEPERKIDWQSRAIARRPYFASAYFDRACARLQGTFQSSGDELSVLESETFKAFARDVEAALQISPRFGLLRILLAAFFQGQGRNDLALRQLDLAIQEAPEPEFAHVFLNYRAHTRMGWQDYDGAIEDYNRLVRERALVPDLLFFRSIARLMKGDSGGAAQDLAEATRGRESSLPEHYITRGHLFLLYGRRDEAEADYRRAHESAEKLGQKDRAEQALSEIKSLKGSESDGAGFEPRNLFQESLRLHGEKKYREAIAGFRRIVDLGLKGELTGLSAYNMACGHALLGEKAEALNWLEKAATLGFKDADHLANDPDLESLRGDVRFATVKDRLKAK